MSQPTDPNQTVDETPPQPSFADGLAAPPTGGAAPTHLELLEEIGRGGMGAILRGRDVDFGRDVAVKVLRQDHRNRAELAQRFLVEARIAGCLQHPGVAPVYSLGRLPDGRPYFTMKLVKGRTLTDLLAQRKEPGQDRPRFLGVFEQVCQTLAYAHSKGVIHRDLKPLNVMVGAFGEVQVMDWGLAKVLKHNEATGGEEADPPPAEFQVGGTPCGETSDTDEHGSETRAGTVLGTPSYMAPEQARGEIEEVDRRSDVFGLGAILCEVLTGRPPFAGSGAAAREQAAWADLADANARLDGCGGDAELITLAKRCLAAKAADRPQDAGEVAAAVTAYRGSVELRLRQAEVANAEEKAKALERRKRRRVAAALAASILLSAAASGVALWWYQSEHARRASATEHDVTAALGEATAFGNQAATLKDDPAKWEAALAEGLSAVKRAEGVLNAGEGTEALRRRAASARADLESADKDRRMIARLDEALLRNAQPGSFGVGFDNDGSAALFAAAFKDDMGLDLQTFDPEQVAAHVSGRAIGNELLEGLDDWLFVERAEDKRVRIQKILRAADPDANSFRNRLNKAVLVKDRNALTRMANGEEATFLSAANVAALGRALGALGEEGEVLKLLRKGQSRYPNSLWINFDLAQHLQRAQPPAYEEAVRFFTVAAALHPSSAGIHNNLGFALRDKGDREGAAASFRRAAELNPKNAESQYNLGFFLYQVGDLEGAVALLRKAIELDPKFAAAHDRLGFFLQGKGDLAGAAACYRRAVELDPKFARAQSNLGWLMHTEGDQDGAAAMLRKAIKLDPKDASAYDRLGFVLRDKGDLEGAAASFRRAVEVDPKNATGYVNLGVSLRDQGKLDELVAEFRAFVQQDGNNATALDQLGWTLRLQGKLDEALALSKKAAELEPKDANLHNSLAFALRDQGKTDQALAEFREAVRLNPQSGEFRASLDDTAKIAPMKDKLPALQRGEFKPRTNDELHGLSCWCEIKKLYGAATRMYADAFAADPKLAADLKSGNRYNAACYAALAAAGKGKDEPPPDETKKTDLGRQALAWLRADLELWTKQMQSDKPADRKTAVEALRHWQQDTELAGLRDAAALAKLPAVEQEAFQKLWADVQALLDKTEANK